MPATIIDGKAVAAAVRQRVADEVAQLRERTGAVPGLATILVGEDPASAVYVSGKRKALAEVGMADFHRHLSTEATQDEVASVLEECNGDRGVSGILLQLPLPPGLDAPSLTALISPEKDVDGLTPTSSGRLLQGTPGMRPCTPQGVVELLESYEVELDGAQAAVVGRSILVGKPVSLLLLERNATVTMCHSRTRNLAEVCARADVLVVATGKPRMVGADHVKPGAAVIDVGINRTGEGLVGDVDFDAVRDRAGVLTPVPGGVGPMTVAMLLRNTLTAAALAAPAGQSAR